MKVVAVKKIKDALLQYPASEKFLSGWLKILQGANFSSEENLRETFGDIRGFNCRYKFPIPKSRLLVHAMINFDAQVALIEEIKPGNL